MHFISITQSWIRIELMTEIKDKPLFDQRGLTLVEIIAVLLILAILAVLAAPRFIDLETGAKQKAIDSAIGELNGRENLTWADQKISASGYIDDDEILNAMAFALGPDYTWNPGEPNTSGGTINYKGIAVRLIRMASEINRPAKWKRAP